jgi:2-methylcitrate dehydratase PrpD
LRHGLIDHDAFVREAYTDPSIRPLMNRVTVRVDDEFEKDFPRVVHMRVTAKDRAGRAHQAYVRNPLGHEDNPVSAGDLAEKFRRLVEPRLGRERTAAALQTWQGIEALPDVSEVFSAAVVQNAA